MGKIPNFTDSERFKTPKTDFLLNFTKTKSFISLDSRFVDLQNTEERATLSCPERTVKNHPAKSDGFVSYLRGLVGFDFRG